MKSARIIKTKEHLVIEDLKVPNPKEAQVLVRVKAAGICHSDLHLWEGGYMGAGGKFMKVEDRGVHFPLTPGHEVSGIIEDIGESVLNFQRGDEVLVYPWIGDGICRSCKAGEEHLCEAPKTLGIYQDGGYSDLILVPNYKYLIKLHDIDFNSSASLACSGLTAYTAIKKSLALPGENLVIIGAGGLGLMAIILAKAITGSRIIALDRDDAKLKAAKKNGDDDIINSKNEDAVKTVMELTDKMGADAVIDFVNASSTVEVDMNLLRRRAKVVLVGLFGGELKLNLVSMPTRSYKLIGSYTGSINDLIELVSLAKRNIIKPVISNRFKLDEATKALSMLKEGKILGRGVINP